MITLKGLVVIENRYLAPGTIALVHDGEIVWTGPLTDPWEDVACDSAIISSEDYDRIKDDLEKEARRRK